MFPLGCSFLSVPSLLVTSPFFWARGQRNHIAPSMIAHMMALIKCLGFMCSTLLCQCVGKVIDVGSVLNNSAPRQQLALALPP